MTGYVMAAFDFRDLNICNSSVYIRYTFDVLNYVL